MNAEDLLALYDRVADAPDATARLRRFVLDLAVRGKLVPQDPSDEPVAELLKRIDKDRLAATTQGRFKPISGIPKEVSSTGCDIPKSWAILPLPRAVYFQEGPGLRNWQFRPSGVPFLNIRTLQNGRVNRELCQFLDRNEVQQKYQHFLVSEGDILCSTSGTIGKLAIAQG